MGNQVTTLGQIYPVEYYLADCCNDFTLDASLGSTRFMKVARVRHREAGYCVAKVYALNDPSIPIQEHKLRIEEIRESIKQSGESSLLPFVCCLVNEKCAILLRQFIKYNLYDRLSTRPFLTQIEKRWIAYQLLRCIQSLHKLSIFHGDIKSENVLVTSFLWVSLGDFASYKPVTLPENNPSDFSYFFDTSRRHCCNMAPERFVEQPVANATEPETTTEARLNYPIDTEELNHLTSQMDLFSLGCVLAELFSEDTPNSSMFDLGQILMFKKQEYDPSKFVEGSITDPKVRRLIMNLTDLDPGKRNSASYHLEQLVPSLFPAYFQTLYDYFAKLTSLDSDTKIMILHRDLDKLTDEIITERENGLLLPLILATSTLRNLKSTDAKLIGIRSCVRLIECSPPIMSEYILDRLLPYIMYLLAKSESRVRALCVSSLSRVLKHVKELQPSDSNVFIDYILPSLLPLAYDPSTLVRITLAANASELAEISKNFLNSEEKDSPLKMNLLQESFGAIVGQLLVDPNNHVRRAMLKENIQKLCDFFGAERTDEVILSHIITFLNDKSDFRLRAAFFDNIGFISSSLGPNYALVMKPLMQKGLADSEEIIIYKCLKAISSMTSSGLLTNEVVFELFQEAIPLLSFPNKWIRNAVIQFVLVLSKADESIDFNRRILPAIKLHLQRDIHNLQDEVILLDSLKNPLPRSVIDSIMNDENDIDDIFHTITKRKVARDQKRYRTISDTDTNDYDALADDAIGIRSESNEANVDRLSEDRLIDSELILRRMHKNKRTSSSKLIDPYISIRRQDAILRSDLQRDSSQPLLSSTVSMSKMTRPKGILLAHLHEHKGAVNKLVVVPGSSHFISCSSDSTIKFWDSTGIATKPHVLFRSKQTFISPDAGSVSSISVCMGSDTLLALTDSNNLHMLQLYSPSTHFRFLQTVNYSCELDKPGLVTGLVSLSPYTYATCSTSSRIRGYDLRLPTTSDVWSVRLEGKDGLITCLDGNEYCVACGTSSSVLSLFDLRFYIRATSMSYPPHQGKMRRIRHICLCNDEIYCSVDGNNEVSTWNCESASRIKTLWHQSHNSVLSMIVGSNSVITAGDDMKIKFWDLNNPHRSYTVSKPATSKPTSKSSSSANSAATPSSSSVAAGGAASAAGSTTTGSSAVEAVPLSAAHHDSIGCLASSSSSSLLLSASRDGVIKIWR